MSTTELPTIDDQLYCGFCGRAFFSFYAMYENGQLAVTVRCKECFAQGTIVSDKNEMVWKKDGSIEKHDLPSSTKCGASIVPIE